MLRVKWSLELFAMYGLEYLYRRKERSFTELFLKSGGELIYKSLLLSRCTTWDISMDKRDEIIHKIICEERLFTRLCFKSFEERRKIGELLMDTYCHRSP